jgi:surfactin synthase thioesterase subunit
VSIDASAWFGKYARSPVARVTLFCFPYSGGGASIYNAWRKLFPPEIEISPIHLPGREERIEEPIDISPVAIARAMAQRIDMPFAVYGHSMGARLGFDVLRHLRGLGVPPAIRFYPAACPPPDEPDAATACVTLPDEPFIDALIERLDAPQELRELPELRQLLLPLLRHDLGWCYRYRHQADARLPPATAMVAVAGEADRESTPEVIAGWARQADRFKMLTIPGGHLFVRTAAPELTAALTQDLIDALAEPADPLPMGT